MTNRILIPGSWILLTLGLLSAAGCSRQKEADGADQAGGDGMAGMDMGGMGNTGDSAVSLERTSAARLGITFARAASRPVRSTIRLAGTLTYAEPRRSYVNARVSGWVESLQADYVGKPVRAGEPLLALYSPELVSAQEEYLAAHRLRDSSLMAAARRRLSLWNIAEQDLDQLERTGQARRTLIIRAPRSGEVIEKMVTDGQAVQAGDNLFLIADRGILWVDMAVSEMDAPNVKVGTPVSITVSAVPGVRYPGKVTFIQPVLEERTRTLTVRMEIANPDGRLRPGMYATGEVSTDAIQTVSVPIEAVLPTGTRNIVFVNRGDGAFVPREVLTGVTGDSLIEIRQGLKPGDEVVASATYLLDSESNLAAAMQSLMLRMGMGLDMGDMKMPAPGGDTARRSRP